MGTTGSSPMACCSTSNSAPCCSKTVGVAGDIIEAPPVDSPGLAPDEQIAKQGGSPGDADSAPNAKDGPEAEEIFKDVPEAEEIYADRSTYVAYVGQLVDGRRHGTGAWTARSEQYTGQWKADQRDGQGRQTWQDGRLYDGQFSDGKFHGKGRMEWHTPNGLMIYEGQYMNDVKHGNGKYKWPDNRVYDGEWVHGKRSGMATYTNLNGEVKKGIWKDDRIDKWLEDVTPASTA